MTFEACALVLLGGFFGGISRFFVSGFVGRRIGETFPWGTLVVNVSGALVIGALAGLARSRGGAFGEETFRDLAFIGFLGGYTTVSWSRILSRCSAFGMSPRYVTKRGQC